MRFSGIMTGTIFVFLLDKVMGRPGTVHYYNIRNIWRSRRSPDWRESKNIMHQVWIVLVCKLCGCRRWHRCWHKQRQGHSPQIPRQQGKEEHELDKVDDLCSINTTNHCITFFHFSEQNMT